MKLGIITTVTVVVVFAATALSAQESVCDLFAHLPSSDNTHVVLHGDLLISKDMAILGAIDCEHRYISKSMIWPIALLLRPSQTLSSNDLQQLRDTAEHLEHLRASGKVAHATATFSGKLRVAEIGSLTGEVVYDSFKDVKIEVMPETDSIQTISICDLFKDLPASRGKRIAARGELVGTDEGLWIIGRCKGSFYTDKYRWPVSLNYGIPAYYSHESEQISPAKYISPPPEFNEHGEREILTATFVGVLRMRSQYSAHCMQNGWYQTNGFGHLNGSAAELVVEDIAHVEFSPAPDPSTERKELDSDHCVPAASSK
jgi:hypothetical protein